MKLRLLTTAVFLAAVMFWAVSIGPSEAESFDGFRFEPEPLMQYPAYQIIYGATLPAFCNPNTGDVFRLTAGTTGLYYCSAANVWTQLEEITPGGQVLVPDGTAALPGIAWISETDTGVYRAGAGQFTFSVATNPVAEINSNGFTLDTALGLAWGLGAEDTFIVRAAAGLPQITSSGNLHGLLLDSVTRANLLGWAAPNGSLVYCSDCGNLPACAAGTGALAIRENGAWNCQH